MRYKLAALPRISPPANIAPHSKIFLGKGISWTEQPQPERQLFLQRACDLLKVNLSKKINALALI